MVKAPSDPLKEMKIFRIVGRIRFRNGTYATREVHVETHMNYDEVCTAAENILSRDQEIEEVTSFSVRFVANVSPDKYDRAQRKEITVDKDTGEVTSRPMSRMEAVLQHAAAAMMHRQGEEGGSGLAIMRPSAAPSVVLPTPGYSQRSAITTPEPPPESKESFTFPGVVGFTIEEGVEADVCFE